MVWTSLHRELGEAPRPLGYDLIEAAIAQRLEEQSDLDWKLDFPHVAKPDGKEEFAKDVAAMANSGGGLLVYGIAEDPGPSSAAVDAPGVAQWGDAEQRRLRQIAYSVIRPAVHKLEFVPLTGPEGKLVVVLTVPASVDAPHLVWSGASFTVPIRYGPQTQYMTEAELERAYRQRFDGRQAEAMTLNQRIHEAAVDREGVWLVASALPLEPRAPVLGRPRPRSSNPDSDQDPR